MPPPRNARGGPVPTRTAPLKLAAAPASQPDSQLSPSAAIVADPARQLEAWRDTALWLQSLGLDAGGVPEFAAAWLRREHGITVAWAATG